ncbi:unnamed protein product [Microthlaspi erraticum]|uniref:Retrotransposon Copia-like N-terminal domain-containing protein n=1 Tax=Microthlaspi erraticum TaxID=1685480 RepID=A0A6D2HGD9_9BRAS|nr:unnamed protein product [Microthlaspi erraticum]
MANVTKLSSSNYLMWSLQVHSLFDGYGLAGHLDGSKPAPHATCNNNASATGCITRHHCFRDLGDSDEDIDPTKVIEYIPVVKDSPMTRSKTRRLREGFNEAVETLLNTMNLGDLLNTPPPDDSCLSNDVNPLSNTIAPELALMEDFARMSLEEDHPHSKHCKSIYLAGNGVQNKSELEDMIKTRNVADKELKEHEDVLGATEEETLEDLHQVNSQGTEEEDFIIGPARSGPGPDKLYSTPPQLNSRQKQDELLYQRSFHHLCGAIDPPSTSPFRSYKRERDSQLVEHHIDSSLVDSSLVLPSSSTDLKERALKPASRSHLPITIQQI